MSSSARDGRQSHRHGRTSGRNGHPVRIPSPQFFQPLHQCPRASDRGRADDHGRVCVDVAGLHAARRRRGRTRLAEDGHQTSSTTSLSNSSSSHDSVTGIARRRSAIRRHDLSRSNTAAEGREKSAVPRRRPPSKRVDVVLVQDSSVRRGRCDGGVACGQRPP